MTNRLKSIELFTGAGGLALGVSQAGFEHLALVELNADAVASINLNRASLPELGDWPARISPTNVRDVVFSEFGRVHLIAAGAPCQPFSLGGKHRGHADSRNLFPDVFRAVREIRPDAVIIENVRGLLRRSFKEYFDYIELQLRYPDLTSNSSSDWRTHVRRLLRAKESGEKRDLFYRVSHKLVNAADFGIAQKRERVFIVAFRGDLEREWVPPKRTHSYEALLYEQWVTGEYWVDHGLKPRRCPDELRRIVDKLKSLRRAQLPGQRWRTVRDAIRGLPAPALKGDQSSIANHVLNPGARVYPGHTGSPLDLPAKTLKAGDHGVPGGENMLVDDRGRVRYFTVREAARLQGFPDSYRFSGAWSEGFRQLGNAVPVGLAEAVARSVARTLIDNANALAPTQLSIIPASIDTSAVAAGAQ